MLSLEMLSKLIPIAQILIVVLTIFTIWATVEKGKLEKQEKLKLKQEIQATTSTTLELSEKNKSLETALTESKNKLTDLQKKTSPRSLLSHQRNEIIKQLAHLPPCRVIVACVMSDVEGCSYAAELNGIFAALNWHTSNINKLFLDDAKEDVAVTTPSNELIPISEEIIKTFNKVNIRTNRETLRASALPDSFQQKAIYLVVGSKKIKK